VATLCFVLSVHNISSHVCAYVLHAGVTAVLRSCNTCVSDFNVKNYFVSVYHACS